MSAARAFAATLFVIMGASSMILAAASDQPIVWYPNQGLENHWVIGNPAGHYLVGFTAETSTIEPRLWVQMLDASGNPDGAAQSVSFPTYERSAAAYDPLLNEYLVVAPIRPQGGTDQVVGNFLTADGIPYYIADFQILVGNVYTENDASPVQVAFCTATREYLVTAFIEDASNPGMAELWGQRIDSLGGGPVGIPFLIAGSMTLYQSHSLVYVPVVTPEAPQGYFMLAINRGSGFTSDIGVYMLDVDGALLCGVYDCTQVPPVCVRDAVPVDLGTNNSGVDGYSYNPHFAFGEVGSDLKVVMVWEDTDNWLGGYESTGIWSTHFDATRTEICSQTPYNPASWVGATCYHDFHWWNPRVAYIPGAEDFLVVWSELPTPPPAGFPCSNPIAQDHVRGQWLEHPGDFFVLSRSWGTGDGVQKPRHPWVAAGADYKWLASWDDQRNGTSPNFWRDIYGTRGQHPSALIFEDGFESGNTSAWSVTMP